MNGGRPAAEPPRGVVFDLDGVLVDSFGVMRQAFALAYTEVVGPQPPPFAEYLRYQGWYFPDIMREMGLPPEMEQPFVRESHRLLPEVVVYPEVPELLTALRARGLRLAVATGKTGTRARTLLERVGLLEFFAHVVGSDEVARPKPAPDIVRAALGLLGLTAGEAVMVGDAVTDLASAASAGVLGIAALWGETDRAELVAARPAAVLERPLDLLPLCPAVVEG